MNSLETDFSVFEEFDFEKPPVGIKFLYRKPEELERTDKKLPACEMIAEAQRREDPFYFDKDNENCVGTIALGMEEEPPWAASGQVGAKSAEGPTHHIYNEPRANARLYYKSPTFKKDTVNYVALSNLDALNFEPDLLVIMATPSQAEIIFRSIAYSTGHLIESKIANVFTCSWMFAYPYIEGKINYMTTGLAFGAKAKEIFEEGWIMISLPWDWFPTIIKNLEEMEWELPSYKETREEFEDREKRMLDYLIGKGP